MSNLVQVRAKPNTFCKIGIIGSKEVGKTTLANLLTGQLKSLGISSDLVPETAKLSPLKLNEKSDLNVTYWLLGSQIAAEALVHGIKQFAVCDRTVIDFVPFLLCSIKQQGETSTTYVAEEEISALKYIIRTYVIAHPYEVIIYVPIRPELWEVYGEPSDIEFQAAIDLELRLFLKELGVSYYELKSLDNMDKLQEVIDLLFKRGLLLK